jgi:hypothetical protein
MADASTSSTATHNANDVNGTISITSLARDVDDVKTSIKNTNSALKGITDGFAANFFNQYNSLASIGITAAAYCVVPGAPISSGLSDFEA